MSLGGYYFTVRWPSGTMGSTELTDLPLTDFTTNRSICQVSEGIYCMAWWSSLYSDPCSSSLVRRPSGVAGQLYPTSSSHPPNTPSIPRHCMLQGGRSQIWREDDPSLEGDLSVGGEVIHTGNIVPTCDHFNIGELLPAGDLSTGSALPGEPFLSVLV